MSRKKKKKRQLQYEEIEDEEMKPESTARIIGMLLQKSVEMAIEDEKRGEKRGTP